MRCLTRWNQSSRILTLLVVFIAAIGVVKSTKPTTALAEGPSTQASTQASKQATTQATTQPTTQAVIKVAADAPIRRWFDRLADRDPKVRDQARFDLMGLGPDDLPALRQLVIEHKPLFSTQAAPAAR